ncbi:hypothetical protein B7R54_09105 [Subtercola boreus]|uniref:Uncharacterized protein n=1 Tax=Subtercola boreus TaxID=120213 RepID=A0A3E0VIC4_9MICO|nr:hypothetical protein [Subtercola boreus]RFA09375.1 hypothetical protein B7R54_09105 [Subtercola boreus]TQL53591.1 hypothetical protein FB464_1106 [Subtercola boreus]
MTFENEDRRTRHAEKDAAKHHSDHGISERDQAALDRVSTAQSEEDTEVLQNEPIADSDGVDGDTDLADINVLPGTGGPDDDGDIEVDPAELNLSGDSIPGHPKPASHPH